MSKDAVVIESQAESGLDVGQFSRQPNLLVFGELSPLYVSMQTQVAAFVAKTDNRLHFTDEVSSFIRLGHELPNNILWERAHCAEVK